MAALSLDLQGRLLVSPTSDCSIDGATSSAKGYRFALRPDHRSAVLEGGSSLASVASPDAFEAQPWTNGLLGRVVYFRMLTDTAMRLQITLETAEVIELPLQGTLGPWELPPTERATGLAVKGTGKFEWVVLG